MKRKVLCLLAMSLCLSWGFSMSVVAQDTAYDDPLIYQREGLSKLLDTPEIKEQMDKARDLAGNALNLLTNQRGQCRDFDDTFTIWNRPTWTDMRAVPTKVFDNVYYVGGKDVGGWVIDTGDGYIMLDSYYAAGYESTLLRNFAELGLDPAKVKYILVTHGGPDHVGSLPLWLADNPDSGVEVIYNQQLVDPFTNPKAPPVSIPTKIMEDGAELTLGDTTVKMVLTPRSVTGGGFSYLIPVWVNGNRHMWATFGNTGQPVSLEEKAIWRASIAKFRGYVKNYGADIALSSHPFVDGSLEYMEMIRECRDESGNWNRKKCGKNPLVIGQRAARRMFAIFDQCAVVQTMRQEARLSENGLACGIGYKVDPDTGKCEPFQCEPGYEVHPKNNICVAECSEGVERDRRTGECLE